MAGRLMRAARNAFTDVKRTAAAAEKQVKVARRTQHTTQRQLKAVVRTLEAQRTALERIEANSERVESELRTLRIASTQVTMREVHEFIASRQMTYRETLETLVRHERSFARFGDGELRLMVDPMYRLGFQVNEPDLRDALRACLQQENPDLLVGWPRAFWTTHNTTLWAVVWDRVKSLVPPETRFGNSHVSRPDCFQALGDEAVELWRQVWDGRAVTVVTGRGSRFDLEPRLFDNIAGHDTVLTTPRNAFADIDRLEREILAKPDTASRLHLLALGPTGTVLAARLAAAGIRAIDVGHLANSYRFVVDGGPYPESISGGPHAPSPA